MWILFVSIPTMDCGSEETWEVLFASCIVTCKLLFPRNFYSFATSSNNCWSVNALPRPLHWTPIARHIKRVNNGYVVVMFFHFLTNVCGHKNGDTKKKSYFCHLQQLLEFCEWTTFNMTSLAARVFFSLTLLAILCIRMCLAQSGIRRRSHSPPSTPDILVT